jgi:hypothetical protein
MAVYKVPQDVEADDKLIGPFSFRQFIYLIIVALSVAAAWGLGHLFLPLAILPFPLILFFGALALPLRKDQPMEIYLAAMLSFLLKPHKRLWDSDGLDSLIEITVPKTVEVRRTKDISQSEAQQRFGYLADLVDSQGWAVRGIQAPNSAMTTDAYFAAQQTEDILDDSSATAQSLDHKIEQTDAKRRQEMVDRMKQQVAAPTEPTTTIPSTPAPNPYDFFTSNPPISAPATPSTTQPTPTFVEPQSTPVYNPYPTIQQAMITPLGDLPTSQPPTSATPPSTPVPTTSEKQPSADIINLANNSDLSIETIAREANRIHEKEDMSEEVVISLR